MGDLDPRIEKVRRVGIGVFVALSIAAIPIGIHIVRTYDSPELWLTLLGAVFMLVLICLYALETALAPIPKAKSHAPFVIGPEDDTILEEPEEVEEEEPEEDEGEEHTEFHEPRIEISPISSPPSSEAAILVEVEEVPTHPPFKADGPGPLEDQAAELDPDRAHLRNPDAPIMTVSHPSIANDEQDEKES